MSYQIQWDNDAHTVILQQYLPGATKDDLYSLARTSAEMINSVSHTVHLIIDERHINITFKPADMRFLEKLTPPNQGAVVMLVSDGILAYKTTVQNIGKKVAPHAFEQPYFAASLEEARQFLQDTFNVSYSNSLP